MPDRESSDRSVDRRTVRSAFHCLGRVARLLARRQLHLHRSLVGRRVEMADGRCFTIYRESSSSEPCDGAPVSLAMWFHLRGVPTGARFRAYLFERESILNTALYAGFEGYRTKLWTVDRSTNDYAGFYTWRGREQAERYAAYAMRMLAPISVPGSLGHDIVDGTTTRTWRVLADEAPGRTLDRR
jgi:hypothetical protein